MWKNVTSKTFSCQSLIITVKQSTSSVTYVELKRMGRQLNACSTLSVGVFINPEPWLHPFWLAGGGLGVISGIDLHTVRSAVNSRIDFKSYAFYFYSVDSKPNRMNFTRIDRQMTGS